MKRLAIQLSHELEVPRHDDLQADDRNQASCRDRLTLTETIPSSHYCSDFQDTRHRGRSQSPFLPDPPPNSSAPDKSTTTAEPPRYHPNSTQHPDETSESNPMKMIRHDGKSQQVNPERPGQSLSRIFNHHLAMIIILATHRVVTQQITATNHAIHHMDNRNLIRRKHFCSSHPRHHSAPN